MYKGQQVIRTKGEDGCFPAVGSSAFIKEFVGDYHFQLEGCGDTEFKAHEFSPKLDATTPQCAAIEVVKALQVIDGWNRQCPTGQLISIEGHPAVDGGSVFIAGQHYDSNNPTDLLVHLLGEVSKESFRTQLAALNNLAEAL